MAQTFAPRATSAKNKLMIGVATCGTFVLLQKLPGKHYQCYNKEANRHENVNPSLIQWSDQLSETVSMAAYYILNDLPFDDRT